MDLRALIGRLVAVLIIMLGGPAAAEAQGEGWECQSAPNPECTLCTNEDCDFASCGSGPGMTWCLVCDGEPNKGNGCAET